MIEGISIVVAVAVYIDEIAPGPREIDTARDWLRAQVARSGSHCGCTVAMGRDPFRPGLVRQWREVHSGALAILSEWQHRSLLPNLMNDAGPKTEVAVRRYVAPPSLWDSAQGRLLGSVLGWTVAVGLIYLAGGYGH